MLLTLLACFDRSVLLVDGDTAAGDDPETTDPDDSAGDDTGPDTSMNDGASLVILTPQSGDFLPWGEDASFQAAVYDVDGNVLSDFQDVVWSSDVDPAWSLTGLDLLDDTLDVGTHALTATAALPNGDRLAYTIGGVLVQSPYTGVYSGEVQVDVAGDYNGTTYEVGCSGAMTVLVDAYGEAVTGDSSCLISLGGYDLDSAYTLDGTNDAGTVGGTMALDLGWTSYDIDTTGTLTEDGELEGSFSSDILGFLALDGTYTATRLSRDISDY